MTFLVFTVGFVLRFFYVYFGDLADGVSGTMPARMVDEFTGAYTGWILFVIDRRDHARVSGDASPSGGASGGCTR